MLGKLYQALAIAAIAVLLAVGGLVGTLIMTGRLGAEQANAIAAVLRGELKQPDADAEAETTVAEGATSQPADDPSGRSASAEELRRQRRQEQLRRAQLHRIERDLIAQRELLASTLQDLITKEERFAAEQKVAEEEIDRRRAVVRDEGFEREIQYVSSISPQLAKEHLVRTYKTSPPDAVRLLNALPASKGKRILGQLKSPEEMAILHELLRQLGREEVPGSGTTRRTEAK